MRTQALNNNIITITINDCNYALALSAFSQFSEWDLR